MQQPEPLIVTLTLDPDAQEYFDRLRQAHFPPSRNYLAAHVTLFHALPGEELPAIDAAVTRRCDRSGFPIDVTGVRCLGRGVAYTLRSAELDALRGSLAAEWRPWLTRQDRQRWSSHITVQNKVAPETARALCESLAATFSGRTVTACGVAVWQYRGGPWDPVSRHLFRG